jgi:DeoR/GlpR family transcriptional regulator of sugar metabolism
MMRMARSDEREVTVLEFLKGKEKLSAEEAAALLDVSESSARRLFHAMEKAGKVARVYGGVQLARSASIAYSFADLKNRNLSEKRRIAKHAAGLLGDSDILYLDSGTTLFQFAIAVKERILKNELRDVRVITNSLANMEVLSDVCEVILIGGNFRSRRKDFAGYASERFVQCFNYTKAFLGADGLDLEEGFMGTDTDTARLNEILLSRSEEVFVLLDSSKIGVRSFVAYAGAEKITAAITDARIAEDAEARCLQKGFRIIKAVDG